MFAIVKWTDFLPNSSHSNIFPEGDPRKAQSGKETSLQKRPPAEGPDNKIRAYQELVGTSEPSAINFNWHE